MASVLEYLLDKEIPVELFIGILLGRGQHNVRYLNHRLADFS